MEDDTAAEKISRNAPCPCGSGKKYKMCCGASVVAAERAEAAQSSRFWMPDGVTAEKDEQPDDWFNDRPRWRRKFRVEEDSSVDEAMVTLYDNFARAYFKKYCDPFDFGEEASPNGVTLLEFYTKSNRLLSSGPTALVGNGDNMWDLLRHRMDAFLCCCRTGEYDCVVRWDSRGGGPILSLKSDRVEIVWIFSRPEMLDDIESDEDGVIESEEVEGEEENA